MTAARHWIAAWVLPCVLLCAQALGLVHGIVHAELQHGLVHETHATGTPGLQALFDSHGDADDCRLFDALGQQPGAAPCPAPMPPTLAPCTSLQRQLTSACAAREAALFDARGPPAFFS